MKRRILALVFAFAVMSTTCSYGAEISIDDSKLDYCAHTGIPYVDSHNRVQVPLRATLEALGVEIGWIDETRTATATKDEITVEIPIGKPFLIKNGVQIPTDSGAILKNGRIFMPLRAVLEAFGAEVGWKNETQTARIDSQVFYGSDGERPLDHVCEKDHPGTFAIRSEGNYPGNILVLEIEKAAADDTVSIKTDAVKTKATVFPYGEKYFSMLPIDLYAAVGDHDITLTFNEGKSDEYEITQTFVVKNRTFSTQHLVVSESLNQSNNDDKAIAEFVRVVKPARAVSSSEKLWSGAFLTPVAGRLTTDFAQIRYVNQALSASRHSGIDLAAAKGTSVQASNRGKVTLAAGGLLSTGNTIVIDHGMGLFTSYYHLASMTVKVGDIVKKGDVIGTVGSTGFSTGAHLHYAVSVYNAYVNPYQPLAGIID